MFFLYGQIGKFPTRLMYPRLLFSKYNFNQGLYSVVLATKKSFKINKTLTRHMFLANCLSKNGM